MNLGKMFTNLIFTIVIFILTINYSSGLYEDQAGTFDWRQQFVGRPKFVHYIQNSQSDKRVVIGTNQNVVAAINGENGQIGWRQVLEKGSTGRIDDLKVQDNYMVAALFGGERVRCFNVISGTLYWETPISVSSSSHQASLQIFNRNFGSVAVLTSDKVTSLNLETGSEQWSYLLPNSETVKYSYLTMTESTILAVGTLQGSHVSVVGLNLDGSEKFSRLVSAPWISTDTICSQATTKGGHFVCIDKQTGIVQVLELFSGQTFTPLLIQDVKWNYNSLSYIPLQTIKDPSLPEFLAVRANDVDVVVLSIDNGTAKVFKSLPGVSAVQVLGGVGQWTLMTLSRKTNPEVLTVDGFNLATGENVPEAKHIVKYASHHGSPQEFYGSISKIKDGTLIYSMLILSEDDSMVALQHTGKVSWTREEALASILSVELVDLPVSQIMAKMEDEFGIKDDIIQMFAKRFTTQFSQLWTFIQQLKHKLRIPRHHHYTDEETNDDSDKSEEALDEDLLDESYLTRDDFNLHKMIVVVTAPGKIFGLDSTTGKIMWRNYLPNLEAFVKMDQQILPLFVQRTTAHFPHQPVCTILGKNKATGQAMLYAFHPISGVAIDGMPSGGHVMDYKILNAVMLSQVDDQFLHPILLLDNEFKFHTYPESARSVVEKHASTLFVFLTDIDTGIMSGYGVSMSADNQLTASQLWTIDFNRNSQTITNIISKRAIEHVHSLGIVLEDRSVQYKYLNPNLVAVVTEGEDHQQKDSQQKVFFSVYLVDTVTGNLVFHCTHKKSKGPIELIHSENWIVYNYWNQKSRRMELAVLELYEGGRQSNATAFSSFHPPPQPIVMRQAYIFPGHLSTMAVTITEKGIASKELLFALENGGILGLPKLLIDPRRPEVLSMEAREEGLTPYMPELPRPPDHIINYHQSVYNVRGIHTSPAGLESTSLVLCYGLDLFFTRVMPSKMFDVLKEDFDYFFISSVLVGMIVVSVVSQKLAARKALNRMWK